MSVIPDNEMFSVDAPEFDEHRAIEEITSELQAIGLERGAIGDVISVLSVDHDGVYTGTTDTVRYTVMRGMNGRYLLKTTPLTTEER